MLTINEIMLLNQTRESFYSIDWSYGEIFDSNLVDALIQEGITFPECIALAKEDTTTYITLQSQANNSDRKGGYFDA